MMTANETKVETTRGVRVEVEPRYSPQHSDPGRSEWFFLYTVRISNEGPDTVQLMTRHWVITDAEGRVDEVRGPGVVGEQPVLSKGESFEYTSGCPLGTPFGSMQGSYQMIVVDGLGGASAEFDAPIPDFALAVPGQLN